MLKSRSLIRFIVIGGGSTLIDFIIYMIISNYIDISVSKCISMIAASIFSFIFNKKWTFENTDNTDIIQISKYIFCQLINIAINTTVNSICYGISKSKLLAFVVATGCAMIVNYILQKLIVFKEVKK